MELKSVLLTHSVFLLLSITFHELLNVEFLLLLVATRFAGSSIEWRNGLLNDWLLFEWRLLVDLFVVNLDSFRS